MLLINKINEINKINNMKSPKSAKFSLNLINIINKSFNTGLDIKNFYYRGKFNSRLKCVQGFLVSKIKQTFKIKGKNIKLLKNEKIQVEISNKFTIKSFSKLVKLANWKTQKYWLDKRKYFALFLLKS